MKLKPVSVLHFFAQMFLAGIAVMVSAFTAFSVRYYLDYLAIRDDKITQQIQNNLSLPEGPMLIKDTEQAQAVSLVDMSSFPTPSRYIMEAVSVEWLPFLAQLVGALMVLVVLVVVFRFCVRCGGRAN